MTLQHGAGTHPFPPHPERSYRAGAQPGASFLLKDRIVYSYGPGFRVKMEVMPRIGKKV